MAGTLGAEMREVGEIKLASMLEVVENTERNSRVAGDTWRLVKGASVVWGLWLFSVV